MSGIQALAGWHVLGVGAMGQMVAHNLRRLGVDVTLLLRSAHTARRFRDADQKITLLRRQVSGSSVSTGGTQHSTPYMPPSVSDGYGVEVVGTDSGDTIRNLIVTLKAHQTVEALRRLRPRLSDVTNVFLLQNGMGVLEALRDDGDCIGSQPKQPIFISSVTTHGCTRTAEAPFTVRHNTLPGDGVMLLGFASRAQEEAAEGSDSVTASLHLLQQLSELNVSTLPHDALRVEQEAKLLVNCCINPIAGLLGCQNGQLLESDYAKSLMREVCRESVAVLNSRLPRPLSAGVLDTDATLNTVYQVARDTCSNTCSMLQDIQSGRETEIDFLNGYIVSLAADAAAVEAPTNLTLLRLIKSKTALQPLITESASTGTTSAG